MSDISIADSHCYLRSNLDLLFISWLGFMSCLFRQKYDVRAFENGTSNCEIPTSSFMCSLTLFCKTPSLGSLFGTNA